MKDLTQGPVIKQLLGMAAFMLIGLFVQTLYSLIDLYWVGSLGPQAVAAVTVSSNLMFVSLSVGQMLGVGTGALIAQAAGAKDHAKVNRTFNQALSLAVVVTLIFVIPALAGQRAFGDALSADPDTAQLTADYLQWFVPSMALGYPVMVMGAALRGTGNMLPGTVSQVGSVALNMVLAPVLIFGWLGAPKLGVAGAGLATFISVAACFVGLALYFARPRTYLKVRWVDWRPRGGVWSGILRIGLPSALEFALMACYMFFVTVMLKPYGATEQAAFGIGQRLLQAGMLPVMAFSFAASAVVGQNYGARLPARVRETFGACLRLCLATMVLLCVLAQLLPSTLIGAFTVDPAVIQAGTTFLRIISLNLIATGIAMCCFGVLSGLGNTVPTLISSATRIGLIVTGVLIAVRSETFRVFWIWWLSVAATIVQMSLNLFFLRRELDRKLGPVGAVPLLADSS